jgi:very-short-patch-repair endonuclease
MKEHLWKKQRFCSISCSKKAENPMWVPGAKEKMVRTLREIGHRPVVRCGNGRGLTEAQRELLTRLGPGWVAEFSVRTGKPRGGGYPTVYKIDVAHPQLMIAIELDGYSHSGKRLAEDRKKDALLAEYGWSVYRIKNADASRLCSTSKSEDIHPSMLAAYSYIIAT